MIGISFPVQIMTDRITNQKLDIVYPIITGLSTPQIQQRINTAIITEVYQLIHQQGYQRIAMTECKGYYEIKCNERNVLSLSLINHARSEGAPGFSLKRSLTFDTATGKACELKNLFKPDANFTEVLSAKIERQINFRSLPLIREFKGVKEGQNFYITDKSLVLYYQLHEISPEDYGFLSFPISVYEIQNMLDENSPLEKMLH